MTKTTFIPSQPGKNALGDLLVEMRSDILAVIENMMREMSY